MRRRGIFPLGGQEAQPKDGPKISFETISMSAFISTYILAAKKKNRTVKRRRRSIHIPWYHTIRLRSFCYFLFFLLSSVFSLSNLNDHYRFLIIQIFRWITKQLAYYVLEHGSSSVYVLGFLGFWGFFIIYFLTGISGGPLPNTTHRSHEIF